MQELNQARQETLSERERAEKRKEGRKRELEERRRLILEKAKKRKVAVADSVNADGSDRKVENSDLEVKEQVDDFFSSLA